jgi:hypothetical protein
MEWINLAYNRDQWRALVLMIIDRRSGSIKFRKFLSRRATSGFLRMAHFPELDYDGILSRAIFFFRILLMKMTLKILFLFI